MIGLTEKEHTGLNFEELHKEGLERKYYKEKMADGYFISKPFSYTASHLLQLASINRLLILVAILIYIPIMIAGIVFLASGYEAFTIRETFWYVFIFGTEFLIITFGITLGFKKIETYRSLTLVNESFDKAYKLELAQTAVKFARYATRSTSKRGSYNSAMSTLGAAVNSYFTIEILNSTLEGVDTELKKGNINYSEKISKLKDAHDNCMVFEWVFAILAAGIGSGISMAFNVISMEPRTEEIILGVSLLSTIMIFIPSFIFMSKQILFLSDVADLLIKAEKVSDEDLKRIVNEELEKEKAKEAQKIGSASIE